MGLTRLAIHRPVTIAMLILGMVLVGAVAHQKLPDIFRIIGQTPAARRHYQLSRGLAEDLLSVANRNVLSDIAAAAAAIGAAAVTAQVNIEANLGGIKDPALTAELSATAALADGVADRANRLIAAVREEISK